jgi:hypothetical protein
MLGVLNLVLFCIILVVIVINIVWTKNRIDTIQATLDSKSFLDLAEFNKLDKEFKRNYHTYVVNGVMPHAMDQANKFIRDNNVNQVIKDNKNELNNAIDSMPYILNTPPKQAITSAEPTVVKENFASLGKIFKKAKSNYRS